MKANQMGKGKGKGQRPGIRLNKNGIVTRRTILKTTAMLFSRNGYAGTSFREIMEASNVGLGSLVYHFGVKENLFMETINYYLPTEARIQEIAEPLDNCPSGASKEAITVALTAVLSAYLKEFHCNRRASFMPQFIGRILLESSPVVTNPANERFAILHESFGNFVKRVSPHLKQEQILAWHRYISSQIIYSIFFQDKVQTEFKLKAGSGELMERFARHIAETSVGYIQ